MTILLPQGQWNAHTRNWLNKNGYLTEQDRYYKRLGNDKHLTRFTALRVSVQ